MQGLALVQLHEMLQRARLGGSGGHSEGRAGHGPSRTGRHRDDLSGPTAPLRKLRLGRALSVHTEGPAVPFVSQPYMGGPGVCARERSRASIYRVGGTVTRIPAEDGAISRLMATETLRKAQERSYDFETAPPPPLGYGVPCPWCRVEVSGPPHGGWRELPRASLQVEGG